MKPAIERIELGTQELDSCWSARGNRFRKRTTGG